MESCKIKVQSCTGTYLSMQRPPQVALPPQAHAGSHEEGNQSFVRVKLPLTAGSQGKTMWSLCEVPGLEQPLQAGHALGRRYPPVALLGNSRAAAAAAPGQQVGRTGEGTMREQED